MLEAPCHIFLLPRPILSLVSSIYTDVVGQVHIADGDSACKKVTLLT